MKVKDLGEQFDLVTNSQDIESILDSMGLKDSADTYGFLFVNVVDGEYMRVFGGVESIPYLNARVYEIKINAFNV